MANSKFQFRKVGEAAPAGDAPAGTTAVVESVPNAAKPVTPVEAPKAVETKPAPVTTGDTSAALAVSPAPGAVAEYRAPASYGDDGENIGLGDIRMPRLNVVQKVGELSNIFTPGDILLNGETVISQSPGAKGENKDSRALNVVFCGFRSDRFAEKIEGGAKGRLFDTLPEVVKAGGTTDYNEAKATGKPLFQPLAEAVLLIEKPDNIECPEFSYIADGKQYAVLLWAMKGTAYTNGAKVVRTARKIGWLKDEVNPITKEIVNKRGYTYGLWSMVVELRQYGQNFAWAPKLSRVSETSPELRALALSVIGG